jgi:hypothetical protein
MSTAGLGEGALYAGPPKAHPKKGMTKVSDIAVAGLQGLLLRLADQLEVASSAAVPHDEPSRVEAERSLLLQLGGGDVRSRAEWQQNRPPAFQRMTVREILGQWSAVFKEEIEIVRRARNSLVHGLPLPTEDLRAAVGVAAKVLAYLRIGLGDPHLDTDPLLVAAFTSSGTVPPE